MAVEVAVDAVDAKALEATSTGGLESKAVEASAVDVVWRMRRVQRK